ncbi:amidohydrolase [Pedobacter miscanthi]|uniref:Amidohydrolase n=1 Tax=Pedobacter miscanthi TaxID=2259170 RepID=A0A366KRA5_9SPHI|nr:amidohydrolase family protein [Pedobacter miscanthi]RBQ04050.1 amidohydrolase [Pedobacter miscanthi]
MEKHHQHSHGCAQCSCNNPVLEILKEELFSPENVARLKFGLGKTKKEPPQTLMISGGIIRPMIGGLTDTVEAIGIANGKVQKTGTKEDVSAFMNEYFPGFQNKELSHKQTLLPGLIEPHVHIVPTAMMTEWIDVSPFDGQNLKSPYDLKSVGATINSNLPDKFEYVILGRGLDPSLMPFKHDILKKELQTIDNTILDNIIQHRPMMLLSASMHTLYLNTKALKLVFDQNKDVRDKYITLENYINKTKGTLEQSLEMTPAMKVVAPQIVAMAVDIDQYLTELFRLANSRGATFMYDAGLNAGFETLLKLYTDINPELVRIGGARLCADQTDVDKLPKYKQPTDYKPVYYGHVKVVSDGSNQGLTGYQSAYYQCDPPENRGIFNYPQTGVPPNTMPPNYNTLIKAVVNKDWPLMIHANGDQAVTFAVTAYQSALAQYRGAEMRNRIEHCSLLTPDHISDMLQMGVSPSFLIGHTGYWGHAFSKVIFGEKVRMLDLCGSALAAGMRITLHSDNEVSPLGPLRMMEQSITRIMEEDPKKLEVLNEAECLTPEQALVAVTYDAAWQCYADNWVGSLDVDYFADFVILAQDPLSLTKKTEQFMKMRDIPVLETWLGGVQVYAGDAE